ncbi:trypsin-like peptidase domain-containing protein [Amycolatopsis orientalis]|uniref:trypsin-like peptidase domain-containing protein n=1 Tax=Amycolatopsis orientalis TaxID=31958 RepID=UPI00055DD73A|nr:trypsin-like peptidase domain-containing protein [Amycolatopsis orientalis]
MTEKDPHVPDSAAGRQDPGAQPGAEGQAAWQQQTPAQPDEPSSAGSTGGDAGQSAPSATGSTAAYGTAAEGSAGTSGSGTGAGDASGAYGAPAGQYGASPTYGAMPAGGTPNPWSAQGAAASHAGAPQTGPIPGAQQQSAGQPYGSQYPGGTHTPPAGGPANPYGAPGTSVYGVPAQREKKGSAGKLLAGVAAISLVIGGVAGGTVGYLTGGSGSSVSALDAPKPAQQTGNVPAGSVESVAQKLSPSVVELQVSGRTAAGEGSGFVISSDGYILTNNHVVQVAANGGQIQAVFQDGKKAAAQVVGRDPTTDIAVVKVSGVGSLTPVELGRSDDLRVGQQVVAIGSPYELTGTVTSGIVSSLHRPVQAGGDETDQTTVMDAIQTDAAINPGNSGGPLSNMSGQVIGINSAIYSPNSSRGQGSGSEGGNVGIGFAIPIDQARRTAQDIIKTGHATQTFIGAKVTDAPQGGAQLGDITPGSPAEKAGLKSGDVVTKIDNRVIDSANTLVAAIRTRAPNDQVTFTLADGRTVPVTLGGQPVPAN